MQGAATGGGNVEAVAFPAELRCGPHRPRGILRRTPPPPGGPRRAVGSELDVHRQSECEQQHPQIPLPAGSRKRALEKESPLYGVPAGGQVVRRQTLLSLSLLQRFLQCWCKATGLGSSRLKMSSSHSRAGQSAAGVAAGGGTDTRDAEMPATEKDLAEDAPWKKIQQNTFTRWCNEHLKCVSKRIANLQTDLSDGLRLIALLEVLSQKKMHRKHNQRPTFRQMQLENVSVALEFLDRESIKLVSIVSWLEQA
ncbi:hypothetical protein PANDA_022243 [Ailuropoda melanoleuca]|uniref:Calponin-homology (CH) domain-containing protein n=1 Tax=Ailuropoda melanoleuca TaxID=9646 RepID=D2I873_AILME|nr:hypothetical protein PANDA_022243 [Ailuropoda melanoleuca]